MIRGVQVGVARASGGPGAGAAAGQRRGGELQLRALPSTTPSARSSGRRYPNVECIVVDNASTDDSAADPRPACRRRHPGLDRHASAPPTTVRRRLRSTGWPVSRGNYVDLPRRRRLPAPDIASRRTSTCTCRCACMSASPQATCCRSPDSDVVVATGEESNRYIRGGRGRRPKLVRPYDGDAGLALAGRAARRYRQQASITSPPLKIALDLVADVGPLLPPRRAAAVFRQCREADHAAHRHRPVFRLRLRRPVGKCDHRRTAVRLPHPRRQHLHLARPARPDAELHHRWPRRQQHQGAAHPRRSPRREGRRASRRTSSSSSISWRCCSRSIAATSIRHLPGWARRSRAAQAIARH